MTAQQISEAQQTARAWQPRATPSRIAPEPSLPVETLSGQQLVAEVQRELNRLGYEAGPVDGLMGTRSRNAIRDYQGTVGLAQDGQPTTALLARLRMTADGGEVIASSEGTLDLEDGRFHMLSWTRDESGNMQVWADGRRVLQAHDLRLRQGFQGFVLVNHGGDYNLRRVRLEH